MLHNYQPLPPLWPLCGRYVYFNTLTGESQQVLDAKHRIRVILLQYKKSMTIPPVKGGIAAPILLTWSLISHFTIYNSCKSTHYCIILVFIPEQGFIAFLRFSIVLHSGCTEDLREDAFCENNRIGSSGRIEKFWILYELIVQCTDNYAVWIGKITLVLLVYTFEYARMYNYSIFYTIISVKIQVQTDAPPIRVVWIHIISINRLSIAVISLRQTVRIL